MCELLVRVVDKLRSGDLATDCQRSGRGDVIVCAHDGWPWSHTERSSPDWMILRVPGMTEAEGRALTAAQPPLPGPTRQLRHKRLFRLNVDTLLGAYPGRRAMESVTVYLANVRAARRQKANVLDPYVIGHGSHPQVIG